MIRFSNFEKQYSGQPVITIPSFAITGGVYWLKGINGSGKSTLLKCLAGYLPFDGQVFINDIDIAKKRQLHRQYINYGEAEPVYPDFLTGNDLVDFYVQTKNADRQQLLRQAALFRLEDALEKKTGAYSSGMNKKLSLLLAFAGQPKWILLDEPLITLDKEAVQVVLQLVKQYADAGVSFILTSHQDMELPQHSLQLNTLLIHNHTLLAQ